jgi:hypothetical protein
MVMADESAHSPGDCRSTPTDGEAPDLSEAHLAELERQFAVVLDVARRHRNVLRELAKS